MMMRSHRRRWLNVMMAGAAAFALASCSTGDAVDIGSSGSSDGSVLKVAISGEPDKLDPHSTTAYFSFQVLENVYDTLVEPDAKLDMQPALAKSWTVSDDQLTWTFSLRDDVTWHDGSDFTAVDVVYSYQRIINEKLATSWRFASVESVSAPDDHTVNIKVKEPSPNLLASLGGYKGVAIVKESNVKDGSINSAPVGTGPFKLTKFAPGSGVSLTANTDYFGGAPKVSGVEFSFVAEPTTALASLQSGQIHWTDNIPPQQVGALAQDDNVTIGNVRSNDYWYLALNEARQPFDRVEVRQAIAYAIDRDAITEAVMFGNAATNQTAIPQSSKWYHEFTPFTYDKDKAKKLLQDAGVDPSSINLDIMVSSEYPETVQAAQIIASQLQDVGINSTIRTLDFGAWLDEQGKGQFDMLMMGWLGNIDPDDFYYSQHHSTGTNNYQKYANPKVDELLDQGRTETDQDKRKDIYNNVAQLVSGDASYIYLYNPNVVQAWNPTVQGYTVMPDRAIRFREVSLS